MKALSNNLDIGERRWTYCVSLWFVTDNMIYETPIWNVECESCDHVNEKCYKASEPKSHIYKYILLIKAIW